MLFVLRFWVWTHALDEAIISVAMRTFSSKGFRVSALFLAVGLMFFLTWAVVIGGSTEPATTSKDRIQVTSPGPLVTFESKVQKPW